jgi:hypothetical protein
VRREAAQFGPVPDRLESTEYWRRQPYYLERRDGDPIALAWLGEEWRGPRPQGRTAAHRHDHHHDAQRDNGADPRPDAGHPAALGVGRLAGPDNDDTEAVAKLLVPAPAELLVARPVTTAVNSTRNDGPELIAEATGDQLVG